MRGGRTPGTARLSYESRKRRTQLLFVAPAVVFLAAFAVFPIIQLFRMSVSDVRVSNLGSDWQFVGLENVVRNLGQGAFGGVVVNTLLFVAIVTTIGLIGGLAVAILLAKSGRWSATILALLVFVWALPPVVNGSVWKFLLGTQGLINSVLLDLGLIDSAVPFLFDDRIALLSVAMVNAWVVIPFNALVFRASIISIPAEAFEAARVDGASRWQEIRFITIPAVRPTSLVLFVLTVVYGFRSFDFIYVMTFGGPGTATTTLPFLGYVQAFIRFDFGLGSATAVIAVLMVAVLAVIYSRSVRREEIG
ncbi:carbohydrate ABC transporter membrane protein 1 (CUT1 family) [Microcella alkaliphila]|uniref:Carbohydrate ABC transporter membrane protein 1 (CUT1 family) n=2 Tax=Microcella alkaliphila TaxID=279828 RepID=A0A4V6MD09_9MICO|nr:carbohydrate ABC transporter membrane protein 1 (CUT1 family) [Microcella alkaliphila]